jgi:ABC-2 type transport system permease protein
MTAKRTRGRVMARALPVTRRSLRESWRGLIGWSVGIIATLVLYLPLYPSLAGPDLQTLVDSLPEPLIQALGYDQIATGAGYTQASFVGLIGFVLFAIAAISWGAQAGGGHEESGRLELDLAHRISRAQFVAEAIVAIALKILVVSVVAWGMIAALNAPSQLDIDLGNLTWAMVSLAALTFAIGTLSLAGGILTGRKSGGIRVGAGVTVVSYVLNAVSSLVQDATWLADISPYAWAFGAEPLTTGLDGVGLALLGGLAVVGIVASFIGLARRDILG